MGEIVIEYIVRRRMKININHTLFPVNNMPLIASTITKQNPAFMQGSSLYGYIVIH